MALTWEQTKEAMRRINQLWNFMSDVEKMKWRSEAWMKNYETWHKYYYHMLISKMLDKEMGIDKLWNVGVLTDVMFYPHYQDLDYMNFFCKFNILRNDGEIIKPENFCFRDFKFSFHNKDFSTYANIEDARTYDFYSIQCQDVGGHGILWPECCSICVKDGKIYGFIDCEYKVFGWYKCYMKVYLIPTSDRGKDILIYAESPARYIEFYMNEY